MCVFCLFVLAVVAFCISSPFIFCPLSTDHDQATPPMLPCQSACFIPLLHLFAAPDKNAGTHQPPVRRCNVQAGAFVIFWSALEHGLCIFNYSQFNPSLSYGQDRSAHQMCALMSGR